MGYRTPLLSEAARQVAEMADGWCGLKELDSSKGEADRLTVDAIEALHAAAAQLRRAALAMRQEELQDEVERLAELGYSQADALGIIYSQTKEN